MAKVGEIAQSCETHDQLVGDRITDAVKIGSASRRPLSPKRKQEVADHAVEVQVTVNNYGDISDDDADDDKYYGNFAQREGELRKVVIGQNEKGLTDASNTGKVGVLRLRKKVNSCDVVLEDDLVIPPRCESLCL